MNPENPAGPAESLEAGALAIASRLAAAGHRALWAGGCVRDRLLGRAPKDIDIATDAAPDRVRELFPEARGVGKAFGVMVVPAGGRAFEVATFRSDEGIGDGRRPRSVRFAGEREDALRRDFTVNALFFDPAAGEVLDYTGGRADLARRIIRAVGDPRARFREDRLRMLRAIRFASTLDFELDPDTEAAIREQAAAIGAVSAERVYAELTLWLTGSPRAGGGLERLRRTGLLAELLPEVAALSGVEQPPEFHPEGDVFTHTALMLDALPPSPDPVLAWAALLHDVGKPVTARWEAAPARGAPRWRFDEHDRVGAGIAEEALRRLRAPSRVLEGVGHCIRNHMRFADARRMRPATLRRLVGNPLFDIELELHRIDCACSHGKLDLVEFLRETRRGYGAESALPAPRVRGADLLAAGLPEGPEIGRLLRKAYDRQLERPGESREALLGWLLGGRPGGAPPDPPA